MEEKERVAVATPTIDTAKVQKICETGKELGENLLGGIGRLMDEVRNMPKGEEIPTNEANEHETVAVPFFCVQSANACMKEASMTEPPKPIWLSLWYQGEICCLFANSGAGKSIYAVQLGAEIAKTRTVLYFDFELSQQQFLHRYSSDEWNAHTFPSTFFRVAINKDYIASNPFPDIIGEVERTALQTGAEVLILDNLTWVATATERAEDAGKLMQQFLRLKNVYGWSILVLAHTPKRDKQQPITENDMAGSKVLFNFVDSAFAIGESQRGDEYRYIKQIKTRMDAKGYGANNVILTKIVKENGFTYHQTIGYSTEEIELGTRKRASDTSTEMQQTLRRVMGEKTMRYTDLVAAVQSAARKNDGQNISERWAKEYVKTALKLGYIHQDSGKKYHLGEVVQ